jgi:hypothetical protein
MEMERILWITGINKRVKNFKFLGCGIFYGNGKDFLDNRY